jgi:hypothetical protein
MYVPWHIPAAIFGIAAAEASVPYGVTTAHFIAVGGVILGISIVVKGYDWVTHRFKNIVHEALSVYSENNQRQHDEIRKDIDNLRSILIQRP